MKVKLIKQKKYYLLDLDDDELEWLKLAMQNPIIKDEGEAMAETRKMFFNKLKEAQEQN